jgi:uncharacterized LabA/DUF88 family protein
VGTVAVKFKPKRVAVKHPKTQPATYMKLDFFFSKYVPPVHVPLVFFSCDVNNLIVRFARKIQAMGLHNMSPFPRLKAVLGKYPDAKGLLFASENFAHYQKEMPESAQIKWVVSRHKKGDKFADIDTYLATEMACLIERHKEQIHTLILISGDKDFCPVLELAAKFGIKIVVIVVDSYCLSQELRHCAHEIIYLYK